MYSSKLNNSPEASINKRKMKNLRKKILLEEFNIELPKLFSRDTEQNTSSYSDLDSIQVKRMDENLFNFIPVDNDWYGSMGDSYEHHCIFADFGQGYERIDVKPSVHSGSNYAHTTEINEDGETICECFIRNSELRTPKTILLFHSTGSNWGQSTDGKFWGLTIHKAPKNAFVINTITKAIEKVATEVAKEITL